MFDAPTLGWSPMVLATSDAANVAIRFFANGAQVGSDQVVTVPQGGTASATVAWNTKFLRGDFVIRAVVDATDVIPELDESNNAAQTLVTVRGNRIR